MPPNADKSSVLAAFSPQNRDHWKTVAAQEIDGGDPFEKLLWKIESGLAFFPYYDAADVRAVEYLDKVRISVAENSLLGNRKWLNTPVVTVTDNVLANQSALGHLNNGADAVLFRTNAATDFQVILSDIQWQYCSLYLEMSAAKVDALIQSIKNKPSANNFSGSLFWDNIPKKSEVALFFGQTPSLYSLGINVPRAVTVEQIAEALLMSVKCIENLKHDFSLRDIIHRIAFSIPCDEKFMETIAKLKALRLLFLQIAGAYGVTDVVHPHIHAVSTVWIDEKFQPHGNLLKGTTTAMACIIGGCDALSIVPEDEANETMSRMARNMSTILREESHFDKVADPLAGSFTLDTMTDSIARESWKLFQSKINL